MLAAAPRSWKLCCCHCVTWNSVYALLLQIHLYLYFCICVFVFVFVYFLKLEAVLLPLCNLKLCLCFAPALKLYKSFTPNQTNTNTNKNTNTSIFTNIFGLKLPQGWDTCCKDSQWQRSISSILSFNFPPHNLIPSFFCGKKKQLIFHFFSTTQFDPIIYPELKCKYKNTANIKRPKLTFHPSPTLTSSMV